VKRQLPGAGVLLFSMVMEPAASHYFFTCPDTNLVISNRLTCSLLVGGGHGSKHSCAGIGGVAVLTT
jgi:hypothetical protein